jgi:hypothetical protein
VSDPSLGLLLVKMAAAAGIVVGCSTLAERSGAFVAAMIATLPISLGPVFVFLAMDHDAAFIAAGALGTMSSNLAHASFVLVYVLLAQRYATLPSLGGTLLIWTIVLVTIRALALPAGAMVTLTVLAFTGVHLFIRPYLVARPAVPPVAPWYAMPLRAGCVALLAGVITAISGVVGAGWSGVLAGLPIVLSSLIVILQPRIGGPASAAVIANGALGLLGAGLGLAAVHLTAVPLGSWSALALGLAIAVGWNLVLMGFARRPRRAAP